MIKTTAIAMFSYNRPGHFLKTFNALKKNPEFKDLKVYIFQDGKKKSEDREWEKMRDLVQQIEKKQKNVEIYLQKENLGLKEAIRKGLSKVLKKFNSVIVIEDDVVTSSSFLKYMLDGLYFYRKHKNVGSICAYNHPGKVMKIPDLYKNDIYFSLRTGSWGWATWADRWKNIDWKVKDFKEFKNNSSKRKEFAKWGDDLFEMLSAQIKGRINTWDILWTYHCFKNNLLTVYPIHSFVNNIGNDDTGIHSKSSDKKVYENTYLNQKRKITFIRKPYIDNKITEEFRKVYRRDFNYFKRKILSKLKLK